MSESALRAEPRVIADATDLPVADRFCSCCERSLRGKFAWLELDQRTDTYHDFGGVPTEKSQGWFPFGRTCARRLLADAKRFVSVSGARK